MKLEQFAAKAAIYSIVAAMAIVALATLAGAIRLLLLAVGLA